MARNCVELAVQERALHVDQPVRIGCARHQGHHELQEEFVALVFRRARFGEPLLQECAACRRDLVNPLFRAAVLLDRTFGHQPRPFHAVERGVDLRRLQVPVLLPASQCLKRRGGGRTRVAGAGRATPGRHGGQSKDTSNRSGEIILPVTSFSLHSYYALVNVGLRASFHLTLQASRGICRFVARVVLYPGMRQEGRPDARRSCSPPKGMERAAMA